MRLASYCNSQPPILQYVGHIARDWSPHMAGDWVVNTIWMGKGFQSQMKTRYQKPNKSLQLFKYKMAHLVRIPY